MFQSINAQVLNSDSIAINSVIDLLEVQQSLNSHQNDSTISNKIYIHKSPTNSDNYYEIRLAQFFSYSEHTVTINIFRVNSITGIITVLEISTGDFISTKQWREQHK